MAGGHAVQLSAALLHVEFAVTGAFGFWFFFYHRGIAVSSWYADTLGVSQIALLAEASNDAVLGAHWAWMWISTGGWAGSAACVEQLIGWAFGGWWHHHHLDGIGLRACFLWDAQSIRAAAQMPLLACTTGDADTWADGVGIVARSIASFALTEFFILLADLWWQWHGHLGWYTTLFRWYTHAFLVLQETWFAETANHALQSASWAWMGISTRWGARRSARHEYFVLFALCQFWWVSEVDLSHSLALSGWHAHTLGISQMSLLAEASNNAVLGAYWTWMWVGAVRSTGRTTSLEFFIVGACWELKSGWDLHGDFVVGLSITFARSYAFALFVLQVSFLTETADHALKGTHWAWMWVLACWCAR